MPKKDKRPFRQEAFTQADVLALFKARGKPLEVKEMLAGDEVAPGERVFDVLLQGQPVLPGNVYLAPGGHHLRIVREGARYFCRLGDDEPVNRHRPSVDVLFESVLRHAGVNACAGILTGMGDDGARGLLALRQAGCHTLAQDERTSVVWGMPGEAVERGAAERVVPLGEVARTLLHFAAEARQVSSAVVVSR